MHWPNHYQLKPIFQYHINKSCSVLSTAFHINGNTNDVCLCYWYWKKTAFANHNNSIFRLWNIFGMQKESCASFFVIASQICHLFDVFSCNCETLFVISKIHFNSLQIWSKVDVLPIVAQKSNQIHLLILKFFISWCHCLILWFGKIILYSIASASPIISTRK